MITGEYFKFHHYQLLYMPINVDDCRDYWLPQKKILSQAVATTSITTYHSIITILYLNSAT